jgi:hypothetical protein
MMVVLVREQWNAGGGWNANRWTLPRRLVTSGHRKTVGDESPENRASREEDHRVARDCQILSHHQLRRQRQIQGGLWLKGSVRHL